MDLMIGVERTDRRSRTKAMNRRTVNGVAGRSIVVDAGNVIQRSD